MKRLIQIPELIAVMAFVVIVGMMSMNSYERTEGEETEQEVSTCEAETEQELIIQETETETEAETETETSSEADPVTEAQAVCETEVEYVQAYPEMVRPESSAENPYCFTESEIAEIARITQLEDGHCGDWCCAYLTASVIINRYLDWGYGSIADTIYANGQYATAYMTCDYISDTTWRAVRDAVANPDRNPHFQALFIQGEVYCQTTCGTYYCY